MKSAWQSTFVMITKHQSIGLAYMIWLLSCSWLLSKNCLLWLIAILQSTKHLHFHHQMQPHPKDMIKDIRLMTLPTYIYEVGGLIDLTFIHPTSSGTLGPCMPSIFCPTRVNGSWKIVDGVKPLPLVDRTFTALKRGYQSEHMCIAFGNIIK